MSRFNSKIEVPVGRTFRLDFTTEALRRLAANVVDVIDADGTYYRAIQGARNATGLAVRSLRPGCLELRTTARQAKPLVPLIERMLGTRADLRDWNERASEFPWLARLAEAFRGLHPPRYPNLWEALAHAIVFQQISIHAAAAIMRRTVEALSPVVDVDGVALRPFPPAQQFIKAGEERLRGCGQSANKAAHLLACARALEDGIVTDELIEGLPTDEALRALCGLRGIGRWSASVVMLRGFGRLDTFPLGDSGVAGALRELSGDPAIDEAKLLLALGPVRGMLYFHLLLGRLRNRATGEGDR